MGGAELCREDHVRGRSGNKSNRIAATISSLLFFFLKWSSSDELFDVDGVSDVSGVALTGPGVAGGARGGGAPPFLVQKHQIKMKKRNTRKKKAKEKNERLEEENPSRSQKRKTEINKYIDT